MGEDQNEMLEPVEETSSSEAASASNVDGQGQMPGAKYIPAPRSLGLEEIATEMSIWMRRYPDR